jgi:hypothetical protein
MVTVEIHVRIAAALNVAFGIVGGILALLILFMSDLVPRFFNVRFSDVSPTVLIGMILCLHTLFMAAPAVLVGVLLSRLRVTARSLGVFVSVLLLFNFPAGTVIGAYTLWVIQNPDADPLFPRS